MLLHLLLLKEAGEWKVKFNKLFSYNDRLIPVDSKRVPELAKNELDKGPMGLSVSQAKLGHSMDDKLPTRDNEPAKKIWKAMDNWLTGQDWNVIINSLES